MLTTLEQLKVSLQAVKRYINKVLPTKVSELQNDAGYINTEVDPTVPNWAKQSTKPTYTATEVGALPDSTIIPDDVWNAGTGTNSVKMKAATEASGNNSTAEGSTTKATKANAHAEGGGTTASGGQSHAEGAGTTASGNNSHAEGSGTTASGMNSHVEGAGNTASGVQSHAEGGSTVASGVQSHAEGASTIASGANQHVQGKYNIEDNNNTYAHIVGNGSYQTRSNAHTLDWDGNGWYAGKLTVGAAPTNNMDVATKQYVDNATPTVPVQDVQINNSSILNNGVANIPIANSSTPGVVKPNQSLGIGVLNDGTIGIAPASAQNVKEGQSLNMAITPGRQKNSVFYGLASAAGDTTQKNSDNAVGTYTENAKTAIKSMLGVTDTPPEIFIGSTIPSGYTVYIDPDGSTVVGEGVSF